MINDNIFKHKIFSRQEEQNIFLKIDSCRRCSLKKSMCEHYVRYRNIILNNNFKLVFSVVTKFKKQENICVSTEDLFQSGVMGLIRAIEKYEVMSGHKFSTYAIHWVRQKIIREMDERSRTIRLPSHIVGKILLLKKELRESINKSNCRWDIDEGTQYFLSLDSSPISLDEYVYEEDNKDIYDIICINNVDNDVEISIDREKVKSSLIREMKRILTDREYYILCSYYEIDSHNCKNMNQLACEFGISRERIRQIVGRCMEKIRNFTATLVT